MSDVCLMMLLSPILSIEKRGYYDLSRLVIFASLMVYFEYDDKLCNKQYHKHILQYGENKNYQITVRYGN